MSPRAWIFDLDDTLFAHRESVEQAITARRARIGGAVAAADAVAEAARWRALEEQHYHRYLSGEIDYEQQRRARVRGFLEPFGVELDDAGASGWFQEYVEDYRAAWRIAPDAFALLDRLEAAGAGLAIITNGPRDFQSRKLAGLGLDARIPTVVFSGEVGVAKPDPAIFLIACERLGVAPAEAAYVGDRLRTDAIGAADAGLTGIWLDRRGEASAERLAEAAERGIRVIRSLDELP